MKKSRGVIFFLGLIYALGGNGLLQTATGSVSDTRIGVFPVWMQMHADNPLASETLVLSLTRTLIDDLRRLDQAEFIPLEFPENLDAENRVNYATLLGRGIEAGCSGLLVLQIKELSFDTKEIEIGRLSFTRADSDITAVGALIEVSSGSAVGEFMVESHLKDRNYQGPEPGDVESESLESEYVSRSLLGKALAEIRLGIGENLKANSRWIEVLQPPPILKYDPAGTLQFVPQMVSLHLNPANDQRFTVRVVNGGTEEEFFIVKPLLQPEGVVVGLKGIGSIDQPCSLNPGEWKNLRLIVNARGKFVTGKLQLGLYSGIDPDGRESVGSLVDTLPLDITTPPVDSDIEMKILKQDPVTLAYVCQLHNRGKDDGWITLSPAEVTGGEITLDPRLQDHCLPSGKSVLFSVSPLFSGSSNRIQAGIHANLGQEETSWSFCFEIPQGKKLYWGICGTCQSAGGDSGNCLNEGEVSFGTYQPNPLRQAWWWVEKTFGSEDYFNPPDNGNCPSGIRGQNIREAVEGGLAVDVYQDNRTCPAVAYGPDFITIVNHESVEEKRLVRYHRFQINNSDSYQTGILNEAGHTAAWPEVFTDLESSRVFVVWEDGFQAGGRAVAFRKKEPGKSAWEEIRYLTGHSRHCVDPVVWASSFGRVVVAWQEETPPVKSVFIRVSRDGGGRFGPDIPVPRQEEESLIWPRLAPGPGSGFGVIYKSRRGDREQIRYCSFSEEGRVVHPPALVYPAPDSCGEPRLAVDERGEIFAVFRTGEGSQSEILFSTSRDGGQNWTSPRQLTRDLHYSEYPKVRAYRGKVWVSYHRPVMGGKDLTFQILSCDRGKNWSAPKALLSTSPWLERASLELKISLSWPRRDYPTPFDTEILLNGKKIGEIKEKIPEGLYRFDIPIHLVHCSVTDILPNDIRIRARGINPADNIIVRSHRLSVRRQLTQIPVFASSQPEADRLAEKVVKNYNHRAPDLFVSANKTDMSALVLKGGKKNKLDLTVGNCGEAIARSVRLRVLKDQPDRSGSDAGDDRLAVLPVKDLSPGEIRQITAEFTFDPRDTAGVWIEVMTSTTDHYLGNNGFRLSLTDGDSDQPTPLLGTDIPNVFLAPSLIDIVKIGNLDGLQDFVLSRAFEKYIHSDMARWLDVENLQQEFRDRLRENIRERVWTRAEKLRDFLRKIRDRHR